MSKGTVALVTGGSRGLGLLIAGELAAREHRVVICARDADELDRARASLAEQGHSVQTEVCDVSDEAAVLSLVDRIEKDTGPIEVLLHVAGVIQVGPVAAMTTEHFRQAIDIMLWGPIHCARAVAGPMTARRSGRIGIVASVGGLVSVPHLVPYSTAKFGAVGFARGLRTELRASKVTVTTITPGLMRTGSHVRAQFVGDHAAEYAWFGAGASLPGISIDADVAAARIVDGVLRGRAMVVLTPLAKIGMRVNGLAPTTTAFLMDLVGRLLPNAPDGPTTTLEGREAEELMSPLRRRLFRWVTQLGGRAAQKNNER